MSSTSLIANPEALQLGHTLLPPLTSETGAEGVLTLELTGDWEPIYWEPIDCRAKVEGITALGSFSSSIRFF